MGMKLGEFFHKLLGGTDYKDIDGVLYVREGFGDWQRLDTHIKNEHPKLYDKLIEDERKTKSPDK
jgi:hypothetical protein